jgi:formylglycine-generating enzyme required for sulfatase activity
MRIPLTSLYLTLANFLSNKHGLIVFCGIGCRISLIALFLLASKSSFADMQSIDDFVIDRTEVTVGQFRKFAVATGYITAAEQNGGGLVYSAGWKKMDGWVWSSPFGTTAKPNEPVVHLTFDEAQAYCSWIGKRLPRDKEWAKAAFTEFRSNPPPPFVTGVTYPYPTGDTPEGANCLKDCGQTPAIDYSEQLTRGIGHSLAGATKAGVNGLFDMGANVWEWTENGELHYKRTRGGSWWYGSSRMKASDRATKPKDMAVVYIGFRCVKDVR